MKLLKEFGKSLRNSFVYSPLINARKKRVATCHDFKAPFLITSAGSSGSHLLGILLDSHPDIMVGPELFLLNKRTIYREYSFFQENISTWLQEGLPGDGPGKARGFFRGVEYYGWERSMIPHLARETASLKEFLQVFFGVMMVKRNKIMWGEKLPDNVNSIKEFLELFPDGRIIHLVRDGRDVAVSLLKRNRSIRLAAESWLNANSRALEWKNDSRVLLVKYEDLVSTPGEVLSSVQKHLGVDFHDLVELRKKNSYWKKIIRNEEDNIHAQWALNPLFSPISAASVGGYKTKLSPDNLEEFCSFSSKQSEFQYTVDGPQSVTEMLNYFGYNLVVPVHP